MANYFVDKVLSYQVRRLSFTLLLSLAGLSACTMQEETSTAHLTTVSLQSQVLSAPVVRQFNQLVKTGELDSSAHWLTVNHLALANAKPDKSYLLVSDDGEKLEAISLSRQSLSQELINKYRHLANFTGFFLDISQQDAKQLLKNRLFVVETEQDLSKLELSALANVQVGEVLDVLYTAGKDDANEVTDLGATISSKGTSFKLWAPTAKAVELLLYNPEEVVTSNNGGLNSEIKPEKTIALTEDVKTGVWQTQITSNLFGRYYQYRLSLYHPETQQVETLVTTDPYSLSLSANSAFSQVVDLGDKRTQPANWQDHVVPEIAHVEDHILYEMHVRDFSASDQKLSSPKHRGKFKAFTEQSSSGIEHLKRLQRAGLTTVHLLPVYDFATVNENPKQVISYHDSVKQVCEKLAKQSVDIEFCRDLSSIDVNKTLMQVLSSYSPSSEQAQALASDLRRYDDYNWGYDPYHYNVPEGSYATDANGMTRIVEFREMVQSLHQLGFRVVMDVVYNHTYQYGLASKSVLDKIVPGYYHRLHPVTGIVEQSTCFTCGNTATERVMMAKLMTDSLVIWARDYKIDGFRFDLMGHQPKSAMLMAREAVRAADPDTYFYGEGWNFGEVANHQRFEQASQLALGGSEIGTFSDRLRDAVRGGGNNTRDSQGLANGLLLSPNEQQNIANNQEKLQREYQLRLNQLRVGLAGNLANFDLHSVNNSSSATNQQGLVQPLLGKDIPYGDQPTGYALDPADTINYVSKHDNQTLWDNNQYRLPFATSLSDRVRLHMQSLSYVMLGQGIPFIHMGSELIRSKSFLRDSYDYGDWFNRVDFSGQHSYYDIGLPPADKDRENWPLINRVKAAHQGRDQVSRAEINLSVNHFIELLAIRSSSRLFRLTTEQQIKDKLTFLNTASFGSGDDSLSKLGLVVMKLDDSKGLPVDEDVDSIIVIFNLSETKQVFNYQNAKHYQLHPVHQQSLDFQTRAAKSLEQGFEVPGYTTSVFIRYQ